MKPTFWLRRTAHFVKITTPTDDDKGVLPQAEGLILSFAARYMGSV